MPPLNLAQQLLDLLQKNGIDIIYGVTGDVLFPLFGPYPYPEREPISANSQIFREGCEALGIRSTVTPLAILSAPFDGRPPCTNRGFCNEGCLPNSKFTTLIQHVPKAIKHGAEILTDCMVTQILVDNNGKVTGVEFNHEGKDYKQLAKIVIVSAYAVESPRLLFNSAWQIAAAWLGKILCLTAVMILLLNLMKRSDFIRVHRSWPLLKNFMKLIYRGDL